MTREDVKKYMDELRETGRLRREAMMAEGMIPYSHEKILEACKELIEVSETADDSGTFDFAASRVQDFFWKLEPILTRDGGI